MATMYFEEEVKTRVTRAMKNSLSKLASVRELDLSDIVREALRAYLDKHPSPSTPPVAVPFKSEPMTAKAGRADGYADSHTKRNLRAGLAKLVAQAPGRNGKAV